MFWHAFAHFGHHAAKIGKGEAFADAAFAVDGDNLRVFAGGVLGHL